MQWLISILVANAVGATLLAVVVFCVSRFVHRPPFIHLLWVLVLAKLLTPPLLLPSLELWPPASDSTASYDQPFPVIVPLATGASAEFEAPPHPVVAWRHAEFTLHDVGEQDPLTAAAPFATPPASADAAPMESAFRAFEAAAIGSSVWNECHSVFYSIVTAVMRWCVPIWLFVAAALCLIQVAMTVRFRVYLSESHIVDHSCDAQVARVARRMGLASWPRVRLMDGILSPMLWGVGPRAIILVPQRLFAEMSAARFATLIAHELAHFKRGDQWVRLLELVTTTLFWWHPVVWLARHEIEIAEEESCDAWVVEHCSGKQRTYAEALLETVDYVSERGRCGPPPIAVSGIGNAPLLRKRLKAIMNGRLVKSVSGRGRVAVGLCAFLALPASPLLQLRGALQAGPPTLVLDGPASIPAVEFIDTDEDSREGDTAAKLRDFPQMPLPQELPWTTARSRDGRFAIDVRRGYQTTLRDTRSSLPVGSAEFTCVAFSPMCADFVAGASDGSVKLVDSATGDVQRELGLLAGPVHSVAYSPNRDYAVATGAAGSIVAFNLLESDSRRLVVAEAGQPVRCVRFSPDGVMIAFVTDTWLSSEPARVEIVDFVSRSAVASFRLPAPAGAIKFVSRDRLLLASWTGVVWQLSADDGTVQAEVRIAKDLVSAASYSSDTRALDAAAKTLEQINVAGGLLSL